MNPLSLNELKNPFSTSGITKAFNAVKKGEDLEELKKTFHESPVCPHCGMRYPDPRRPVCPKCMDKRSTIRRLFSFFGGYKKQVAVIIGSILLSTLIGVFTPQISTNYLYDNVLNTDNMTPVAKLAVSLGLVVLAIFGIRLFNLLFRMAYTYILAGILPWVVYDIKLKIFRAMQRLGVGFYTAKQTGFPEGTEVEGLDLNMLGSKPVNVEGNQLSLVFHQWHTYVFRFFILVE